MKLVITSISVRPNATISNRRRYSPKAVIYFWPENETVIEQLENRRSRPYTQYRKLLPQVFEAIGLDPADPSLKASWSQYAGCSCPCSPGFVLRHIWQLNNKAISVNVASVPEDAQLPEIQVHLLK